MIVNWGERSNRRRILRLAATTGLLMALAVPQLAAANDGGTPGGDGAEPTATEPPAQPTDSTEPADTPSSDADPTAAPPGDPAQEPPDGGAAPDGSATDDSAATAPPAEAAESSQEPGADTASEGAATEPPACVEGEACPAPTEPATDPAAPESEACAGAADAATCTEAAAAETLPTAHAPAAAAPAAAAPPPQPEPPRPEPAATSIVIIVEVPAPARAEEPAPAVHPSSAGSVRAPAPTELVVMPLEAVVLAPLELVAPPRLPKPRATSAATRPGAVCGRLAARVPLSETCTQRRSLTALVAALVRTPVTPVSRPAPTQAAPNHSNDRPLVRRPTAETSPTVRAAAKPARVESARSRWLRAAGDVEGTTAAVTTSKQLIAIARASHRTVRPRSWRLTLPSVPLLAGELRPEPLERPG